MTQTPPQTLTLLNAEEIFGKRPPTVPQFQFLKNTVKGPGETFLFYGAAGTGKTRLAGTAGDRTLFINNGNGMSTLQSPAFMRDIGSNPIVVTLNEKIGKRGTVDIAEVHDAICDTIDFALEKFPDRFDAIIIDDVTQLRRGAMNKGLEINFETKKSTTKRDIVDKYDVVAPTPNDYQMEMAIIEQFVANYVAIAKQSGKYLIMNAHERITFGKAEKYGDEPPLLKIGPGFTGRTFPDAIPSYFDNVWRMEVVGGGSNRQWRATTQGTEKMTAKTRLDGIFNVVEVNPNLSDIFNRVVTTMTALPKRR